MNIPIINIPVESNIIKPYIVKGDTIPSILFEFDSTDDVDLTGASINIVLYKDNIEVLNISDGSGITILDNVSFEIDEITAQNNFLPIGQLKGDISITLSNNVKKTYARLIYTILKEYKAWH